MSCERMKQNMSKLFQILHTLFDIFFCKLMVPSWGHIKTLSRVLPSEFSSESVSPTRLHPCPLASPGLCLLLFYVPLLTPVQNGSKMAKIRTTTKSLLQAGRQSSGSITLCDSWEQAAEGVMATWSVQGKDR